MQSVYQPDWHGLGATLKNWKETIDGESKTVNADQITDGHIAKALDFMRDNASALAKAKGERIYLEQFRKSQKAILYCKAPQGTIPEREAWAYSQDDYLQVLTGLQVAVENEERLKWMMTAAELKVEVWRTQSANNRRIDQAHQ